MANSTVDERTASTGGEVASTPRPLSARPSRSGLWDKLRSRLWHMVLGLLVVAGVITMIYWRIFAPVDVRSHEVTAGDIVAEVMGNRAGDFDVFFDDYESSAPQAFDVKLAN
jgi:hypothetical protein